MLPPALVPSEPTAPDKAYEEQEVRNRIRAAIASLPPRERKVIGLYYYGDATMKQIGAAIGVNESRVSQLHARAVQRLKKALGADAGEDALSPVIDFQKKLGRLKMAKANLGEERGVLLQYTAKRAAAVRRAPVQAKVAAAR
jgi:DNA-binding CsgD family transcriptional regulator